MIIEGKRIIVTGSASGMGEATLNAYVKAGAHVIGMDVSDEKGIIICDEASSQIIIPFSSETSIPIT